LGNVKIKEMENFKTYGCLVLALLSAFILGCYTMGVQYNIKPVEVHQWVLTSVFGLMFLIIGISKLKRKN
jgi:hypothetical protein